jgi:hypothetical protein
LNRLVRDRNRLLVERDLRGGLHFNGSIRNAADVRQRLAQLAASGYAALVRKDTPRVLDIFENLFDHQSFTGRSGTFFGYEGLGSIYWHMVSKLLLAAQESFYRAASQGASPGILRRLAACYYDIRAGLGDAKTPDVYGAFPMDPYSHTPRHTGARQPGLTGQVKEDVLCRLGELGVLVQEGQIQFRPALLRREEFRSAPAAFDYYELSGAEQRLRLKPGELAFTYCQVPIVYRLANQSSVTVVDARGRKGNTSDLRLDLATSSAITARTGHIKRLEVCFDLDSVGFVT